LIETLNSGERWINSNLLDIDNMSLLGNRNNWEFILRWDIIKKTENGDSYIVIDGKKYYEKWEHHNRFMKIFDQYGIPHFYIWEVQEDGLIDDCQCIVLRYDGWIFKGKWNSKWVLKDPHWREYDWVFVDGRPLDVHSRPEFHKKWVYTRCDWTKETYVAYSSKMRPQFISWKDNKEKENWSKKRGSVVSIKREYPTWEIEYMLHSWKRDLTYRENATSYIFESPNWFILTLPKVYEKWIDERYGKTWELRKGSDMAKQLANLINAIENFVCLHSVVKFTSFWPHLQVKYGDMLLRKTLLKNVEKRVWVSAKELSEWLNDYYNEKS
jgi:hypothetical protein